MLPSTFLLDAAARVAGRPVRVSDFERVAAEHGRRVRAGRLTAADARDALTEQEYVRALLEDGSPLGAGAAASAPGPLRSRAGRRGRALDARRTARTTAC